MAVVLSIVVFKAPVEVFQGIGAFLIEILLLLFLCKKKVKGAKINLINSLPTA